jgi:hypothetical protein
MNSTAIPVGHPTMKLRDIAPSRSSSFSPNLYAWMRRYAHFYREGGHIDNVYRVVDGSPLASTFGFGAGVLLIGRRYDQYEGDTDFSGIRLIEALCKGAKASRVCYVGAMRSLEPVEGFWERYLEVGRCAIDPTHAEHFVHADRFAMNGDTRTCLWCGAKHQRTLVPRIVHDETWAAV